MQQENSSDKNTSTLDVDQFPEGTPTDVITDLKTGIYNLYLSLLNHLMVQYGPIEAVKISTEFLQQISNTFRETLPNE